MILGQSITIMMCIAINIIQSEAHLIKLMSTSYFSDIIPTGYCT